MVGFKEDGSVEPDTKFFLSPEDLRQLRAEMSAEAGDLISCCGGRLETDEIWWCCACIWFVWMYLIKGHDFL